MCAIGQERRGTISRAWARLAGYFIPADIARDREAANQAGMFLVSHLFGPLLGNTVPLAIWAVDPEPGLDIAVLAASICLFWVFPFLLRAGVAYEKLVLGSVVNLNFAILYSCLHNGGVNSPTLTWVLIIPILSLFYVGGEKRLQPALIAISGASFAIFLAVYHLVATPAALPEEATLALGAVSMVATLAYLAGMAIYYARIFDAGRDLEVEVRRRQQMAEELRQAIVVAHRAGAAKAEFLARMSHEIRTPLNAIIGYGQILREDADEAGDEQMREDVDRILDAAGYLVRLIGMILDLAKIEAGRMAFDARETSLADVLAAALAARQEDMARRGNRTALALEPGLDRVVVDRARFLQIVDALLENASRHTEGGTVSIEARRTPEGTQPGFSVSVSDTGCGIHPEALDALFETFATNRSASDGRYGGTGLNLSVCYQLARAMGGTMAVTSRVGAGTTFTLRLPLEPVVRQAAPPADLARIRAA